MRNYLFSLCAALCLLSGCGIAAVLGEPASAPPAPLSQTIIDEKALTLAAQTVDVLAISASALVKARVIQAGSPAALSMADGLDKARTAVNLAALARDAGNASSYAAAITKASAAIAQIRTAINKGN